VRIQAIVKELHDEKIDIIEWNTDPVIYISKAISPAKVSGVYLNEVEKTATVSSIPAAALQVLVREAEAAVRKHLP